MTTKHSRVGIRIVNYLYNAIYGYNVLDLIPCENTFVDTPVTYYNIILTVLYYIIIVYLLIFFFLILINRCAVFRRHFEFGIFRLHAIRNYKYI